MCIRDRCWEDRQGPVVHFIYVKELFRAMGLGRKMLALSYGDRSQDLRYTLKTRNSGRLFREAKYKPFLVRK